MDGGKSIQMSKMSFLGELNLFNMCKTSSSNYSGDQRTEEQVINIRWCDVETDITNGRSLTN